MNWAFERGLQAGSVAVVEAVGESPEATAAIWRYLLGIDWLARVKSRVFTGRSSAAPVGGRAASARVHPPRRRTGTSPRRQGGAVGAVILGSRFRGHRGDR